MLVVITQFQKRELYVSDNTPPVITLYGDIVSIINVVMFLTTQDIKHMIISQRISQMM